jgi:hypothetical protein
MTSILIGILRFPPILHAVRIGLASIAEWLLYKLLEFLPWGNGHNLLVSVIIIAAGFLFTLYLLKLVVKEIICFFNWLNKWWQGNGLDDNDNILE